MALIRSKMICFLCFQFYSETKTNRKAPSSANPTIDQP